MKWISKAKFALVAVLLTTAVVVLAQPQTWRINLTNVDIKQFITQVAQITGKTFVIDPRIKGNVTVVSTASLDKDGVYELFLSVLRVHNFGASPAGNIIRIVQNTVVKQSGGARGELSELPAEEIVTRVISAQNVDSAELVKILRPMVPQYAALAAVAHPNVVIISDHVDNIQRLMRIIGQIDVANEDEFVMRPLLHAWVGSVVAILEKVAPDAIGRNATGPQSIRVIANERNNSLILRGKPRPVAAVMELIDKLDLPATTTGATRVIYLAHADAVKVAEILNGLVSDQPGGEDSAPQETSIQADESLNAIVVRSDPSTMNEILDIVGKLDVRRTQVLIEAAIAEISIDDLFALGVEMAAVDARGQSVPAVTTTLSGIIGALLGNAIPEDDGDGTDGIGLIRGAISPTIAVAKLDADGISFAAVLNALATNAAADLLSSPSVLTLDNQEARILVGQEVPFRTGSFTTTSDGASNPFTTIQRENVGIELTVTPHVHEGSAVRLEVHSLVESVLDTGLAIGEAGAADLITNKREIETTILVDDGQTIVLGGLIQDDIREVRKKVPLLGDIPLLGYLFRNTSITRSKRNLLVFLRPTVIRTEQDVQRTTQRMYERIWEVQIESRGTAKTQTVDDLYEGRTEE